MSDCRYSPERNYVFFSIAGVSKPQATDEFLKELGYTAGGEVGLSNWHGSLLQFKARRKIFDLHEKKQFLGRV